MEKITDGRFAPGFVASVFSKRAGAHCIALDLVRVAARVAGRRLVLGPVSDWALDMDQAAGLRRRMAAEFGGYLVTEPAGPPFSLRRVLYAAGLDADCHTSDRNGYGYHLHGWPGASGPLDAPAIIAAGSVVAFGGDAPWIGSAIDREKWWLELPVEPARPEVPIWREGGWVVVLGHHVMGRQWAGYLRAGFEGDGCGDGFSGPIDATDFLAAGSCKKYEIGSEVCAAVTSFLRAGWYE